MIEKLESHGIIPVENKEEIRFTTNVTSEGIMKDMIKRLEILGIPLVPAEDKKEN